MMRDRLVIIDAVKELMKVEWTVPSFRCILWLRARRIPWTQGSRPIFPPVTGTNPTNHQGSRKSTQKVQSHGSGRPTQLSRPSWFPLSRGYCFSWCAKQKRHQRTNARSYAQEVGESLRRVFGCHSVSAFRKKSPQRKIIVSSFSSKTIVIFFILFPNWKVANQQIFTKKKMLPFWGADLALEVRTWLWKCGLGKWEKMRKLSRQDRSLKTWTFVCIRQVWRL